MDLRSPAWGAAVPQYDALSDTHLRNFRASRAFRRHWSAMGPRMKPESSVERLVRAKSKPRHPSLPLITQQPNAVLRLQVAHKRRTLAKQRPDPPVVATSSVYLGASESYARLDAFYFGHPRQRARRSERDARGADMEGDDDDDDVCSTSGAGDCVNELTRTYLQTVERREDYDRRQLLRSENGAAEALLCAARATLSFLQGQSSARREAGCSERAHRLHIEGDEHDAWVRLLLAAGRGKRYALLNEEVRPACPMLEPGESAPLDAARSSALALELRWQSDIELLCVVLSFDAHNQFVGATTMGEVLRCGINGLPVLRVFDGTTGGVAGSAVRRCGIELAFPNFSPQSPIVRFVVAVFNAARTGAPLTALRRCYCTVKAPVDGSAPRVISLAAPTMPLRDAWALSLPPTDHMCYIVASVLSGPVADVGNTPATSDHQRSLIASWRIHSHRIACNVPTHQRLPKRVQETLLVTPAEVWRRYVQAASTTRRYEAIFFEEIVRGHVTDAETTARAELERVRGETGKVLSMEASMRHDSAEFGSRLTRRLGSLSFAASPPTPGSPRQPQPPLGGRGAARGSRRVFPMS